MTRIAKPLEIQAYGLPKLPGHETYYILLVNDEVEGHIGISFGNGSVLAHDLECWSKDPQGAAHLWLAARKLARAAGFNQVVIHFKGDEPAGRVEFYQRLGAKKLFEVYSLPIGKEDQ